MAARVAALLLVLVAGMAVVSPVAAQTVEDEARRIAQELQCPICQGLSVADSPSQLATEMREVIREKLEAGESHDQIIQYFVDRYGENILETPPRNGFTITAWVMPYVAVFATLAFLVWRVTRRERPSNEASEEEVDPQYLAEVDKTFEHVRDERLR